MKTFKKISKRIGIQLALTAFVFLVQVSNAFSFADIISLMATSGNYSDETLVRLHESATFDFDGDWDAYKLANAGNTPDFYTVLNSTSYTINSVPFTFEEMSFDLNLKVAFTGHYSITATSINESYDSLFTITLEDKLLNTTVLLQENSVYEFDASTSDAVERFVLHYKKVSAVVDTFLDPTPDPTAQPSAHPYIGTNGEEKIEFQITEDHAKISFNNVESAYATVGIIDAEGKIVYSEENISTDNAVSISLHGHSSGSIYIARIICGSNIFYKKLYY